MGKRIKQSNSTTPNLRNIDRLIAQLNEVDFEKAIEALLETPPELIEWVKPAVPALIRTNSLSGFRAACLIGPDDEADFTLLLRSLLKQYAWGRMVPYLVILLEESGPKFENRIELIADALDSPHYRVRIAAARALKGMGVLLELVEPQVLKSLNDPSLSVVEAVVEMLRENQPDLTTALLSALQTTTVKALSVEEQSQFNRLERQLWWPRASQLNGYSEDEHCVFVYRRLSEKEQNMSQTERIDNLLADHGFPAAGASFREVDVEQFSKNLAASLKLVFYSHLSIEVPPDELANMLLQLFDEDVTMLANGYVYDDGVRSYGGVTYGVVDAGVICMDQQRIGMFYVSDED